MKAILTLSSLSILCAAALAATPTLESTDGPAITAAQMVAQRIESRTVAECSGATSVSHGPHTVTTRRHVVVRFEGGRLMAIVTRQTLQPGHQFPALVSSFHVRETPADRVHRRFVDDATHGRRFALRERMVPVHDRIAYLTYEFEGRLDSSTLSCR